MPKRSHGRRAVIGLIVASLTLAVLPLTRDAVAPAVAEAQTIPSADGPPATGTPLVPIPDTPGVENTAEVIEAPEVVLPEPGTEVIEIAAAPEEVDETMVSVRRPRGRHADAAPDEVEFETFDQDLVEEVGGQVLAFEVERTDDETTSGKVTVEIDYEPYRHAFGGDWASRLELVRFPECVLTTPEKAECSRSTPVASTNDEEAGVLTALVTADPDSTPVDEDTEEVEPTTTTTTSTTTTPGATSTTVPDQSTTTIVDSSTTVPIDPSTTTTVAEGPVAEGPIDEGELVQPDTTSATEPTPSDTTTSSTTSSTLNRPGSDGGSSYWFPTPMGSVCGAA